MVFLCAVRDFHAMDWFRSAKAFIRDYPPILMTDLISSEGFKSLLEPEDSLKRLIILDPLLMRSQSSKGDKWRNFLKAIVFPFQVILIRNFNKKKDCYIYYAHSMYYIWLAWAASLTFVGTPQGSDILLKPNRSRIYKFLSSRAMKKALLITVDSKKMAEGVTALTGKSPLIVDKGIDISAIREARLHLFDISPSRTQLVSMRGMTSLYRIDKLVVARNSSLSSGFENLTFIYPFYEKKYLQYIKSVSKSNDLFLGRLSKANMYKVFYSTYLAVSIPFSDSSPASVYEAIFCGAPVALTYHPFIDDLPKCMRSRVILVDLEKSNWLDEAIHMAGQICQNDFIPTQQAIDLFDSKLSFGKIHNHALEILK